MRSGQTCCRVTYGRHLHSRGGTPAPCSRGGPGRQRAVHNAALLLKRCSLCRVSLNLDDLLPPPIDGDLRSLFEEAGAQWSDEVGTATTFGNDEQALEKLSTGVVVFDRTHAARLSVAGPDRLRFLHALCTADVAGLSSGGGTHAALLTPTGRVVDAFTLLALDTSCLLLLSPGAGQPVAAALKHHLFPADKVDVMDVTSATACFALVGATVDDVLQRMNAPPGLLEQKPGSHCRVAFQGQPVILVADCGLASPGITLVVDESVAGALWAALTGVCKAIPAGTDAWERLRIAEGVPARGAELIEETNALEAGLRHYVSATKGCYLGQEVIARLTAREGPKQSLWGLRFNPGTPCVVGDVVAAATTDDSVAALGHVSSVCSDDGTALAFIRRAAADTSQLDGAAVLVGPDKAPGVLQSSAYQTRFGQLAAA